jgi:hypothetical protein
MVMTPLIMLCCHDVRYEAVVNKPEASAIGWILLQKSFGLIMAIIARFTMKYGA